MIFIGSIHFRLVSLRIGLISHPGFSRDRFATSAISDFFLICREMWLAVVRMRQGFL